MENTGALTATSGLGGTRPVRQPRSTRRRPSMTRVARRTMGTPVTLESIGTVRDALGFTSRT